MKITKGIFQEKINKNKVHTYLNKAVLIIFRMQNSRRLQNYVTFLSLIENKLKCTKILGNTQIKNL